MIATQYAWPPNVEPFNKGRSNRYYPTPDGEFVGTTTFLKTLGLSKESLVNWSAKVERELCLDRAADVVAMGVKPPPLPGKILTPHEVRAWARLFLEQAVGKTMAHNRSKDAGADVGTEIHDAARRYLLLQLGTPCEYPNPQGPAKIGFDSFVRWWSTAGLKPLRMEQTVWSRTRRVAGTVDLFAENQAGELELWDYKSANGIYDDHHLQVTNYIDCAREQGLPVVRGGIVRLPKTGDKLEVEVRRVGELYSKGKTRERTHEQLMQGVFAAKMVWDLFFEEAA